MDRNDDDATRRRVQTPLPAELKNPIVVALDNVRNDRRGRA